MDDKALAQALYQAGLLTQDQILAAADQRTPEFSFSDIILRNGWVTQEQINRVSGVPDATAWGTVSSPAAAPSPFDLPPAYKAPSPIPATRPAYGPPIPSPSGERGTFGQSAPVSGYQESANGALILVLGIIGVFVIQLVAPVAWIMGNKSLRAIDAGRADASERGLVSAGRIMGIIGSVFLIFAIGLLMLIAILTVSGRRISNTFSPAPIAIPGGQR